MLEALSGQILHYVDDTLAIDALAYNFLPSWWHRNYGVTFGERYVFDPDYRVDVWSFASRTLAERFPGLHLGSRDPEPVITQPDFNNALTAAASGCEVAYPEDNYPWSSHLDDGAVARLKPPETIGETFPYSEIISQVRFLAGKFGKDVSPWLPTRGVLNDAVLIGGTDFLAQLGDGTAEKARALLGYCHSMLTDTMRHNHDHVGAGGATFVADCASILVGPECYKGRLLGYDRNIGKLAGALGQKIMLHHCGLFDAYSKPYREIANVRLLEIGWGSDVRRALDAFPDAVVQYIVGASFLASSPTELVEKKIRGVLEAARGDWQRLRLIVPDVEYGTPEENVYQVYECCRKAVQGSADPLSAQRPHEYAQQLQGGAGPLPAMRSHKSARKRY